MKPSAVPLQARVNDNVMVIQPRRLVQSQQIVDDDDADDDENVELLDIDQFSCSASQSQSSSQSGAKKAGRAYLPRKGSAAWATLVTMGAKSVPYWLTKAQIVATVTESQLCQSKFAWRAVLDVAERGLIDRCVKTQRYALNAAGYALALKLAPAMPAPAALLATPLADDVSGAEVSVSTSRDQPLLDADVRGGNVLLLIDTRELTNHPRLGMLLATRGVPFESRTLTLSDMLFVLSVPRANGAPPLELVMDFAAERKELPDFMASFYDGRYREQKHRLARCGVNNVCYLVEGRLTSSVSITSTGWDPRLQKYGRYSRAIPTDAIRSAMLSTTINDKFIVRHTETMDETADYLASVYRHVARARPMVELAEASALRYLPLSEFMVDNTKDAHLTVRDVFARQLMQVRGCSAPRAAAIVALYPTVSSLCAAYAKTGSELQRSRMLADIRPADAAQRVGPQLSDDIFKAFRNV